MTPFVSRGLVEFMEFDAAAAPALRQAVADDNGWMIEALFLKYGKRRIRKHNRVFDFPNEQYAILDRGGAPESVNARYFTLSTAPYTDPSVQTVAGETTRVAASTQLTDPASSRNSIIRFLLDVGQFVGAWSTAILIGGASADANPGTGKIVAAVNNVTDDTNAPLNRDGTTVHLVNWKIKHLDASEV